jgi:Alpha/beta hydrolase domain
VATISPALDGPPSLFSVGFDLGSVGYSTDEHFATGTATAYALSGDRSPDGHWSVTPTATAKFNTRIVVYRPDRAWANGTLLVEWLNVTGGLDVPALWMPTHRHLVRDGYTWVGVTAQLVGVEGGGVMPGLGLHQLDPDRYASLHHPGDGYAYDLFSQIGHAVKFMLRERGLPVDRTIATGASQSAFYLTTYINAIDPGDAVFDGFLLQGRAGAGAPVEGWDPGALTAASFDDPAARRARLAGQDRIRDDGRAPVVVVQSETDVLGALSYLPARQADTDRFRLWEVAGAAHCDTYFLAAAARDSGSLPVEDLAAAIANAESTGIPTELPINSGPQMHYVLQRAFDALDQWLRTGTAPPSADRLDVDGNGNLVVDALGLARGGVRTPWVDVPTRVLSGLGQPGGMSELFGTTATIDPARLTDRYPNGRDDYVRQFCDATRTAVQAGFLLEIDADEIETLGALAWESRVV